MTQCGTDVITSRYLQHQQQCTRTTRRGYRPRTNNNRRNHLRIGANNNKECNHQDTGILCIPPVAYAQPPLSQQTQQGFDQQDLRVQGQSFGQRVAGRTPPRLALNQWRDVTFADLQRKQPQPSLAILPPLQPSLPRLQQQVIQPPPLTPTPPQPQMPDGDVSAVNVARLPVVPPINVPRTPRQATRTSRYYRRQQKQKY